MTPSFRPHPTSRGLRPFLVCSTLATSLSLAVPAHAQVERNTKPFTAFKINLTNTVLNATMPFDVKFLLWGDAPAGTTEVALDILEPTEGGDCTTGAAPGRPVQQRIAKPSKWNAEDYANVDATPPEDAATRTDVQFIVRVDELSPSHDYCFVFSLKPGRDMTPREAADWSVALLPAYRAYMQGRPANQTSSLGINDIEPLRQEFLRVLLQASGQTITPKPGTLFDRSADAAQVAPEFLVNTQQVFNEQNIVTQRLRSFRDAAAANGQLLFDWSRRAQMQALTTVAGRTQEQADAVTFFRNLTAEQAPKVLAGLPASTSALEPLADVWDPVPSFPAEANPMFDEDTPCPTTGAIALRCNDLERTRQRVRAVRALAGSGAFGGEDDRVLDVVNAQKIDLLFAQNSVNRRLNLMQQQLTTIQASLPLQFTVQATTRGSASTRKTWYLGMDTGIAVAPALNEVFPYVGTNIYFRPVNTSVPPRGFGSRFSLLFGFTWTQNLLKERQRKALYGEDTMVVMGAGLRATEWLRFTGGGLAFQAVSPNPLRESTRIEVTPFVSMSADIDVAKVMGRLFGGAATPPAEGLVLTPK